MKDFLYNIGDVICDNKRNLKILNREKIKGYSKTMPNTNIKVYICMCNKCGDTDIKITEGHLKEGRGCPTCRGMKVSQGINDIPTTAPWMIPYFQGGYNEAVQYTNNSNKRIIPICPYCGRINDKALKINKIYTNRGFGCICSDGLSYPEKFFSCVLEQLGVEYKRHVGIKHFKWINNKIYYDFYINKINCIVETNGAQHYTEGQWKKYRTLEEEQKNDDLKEQMAISNDISLYVRLDCRRSNKDFIKKSILSSELINYFDFTNIDWDKCDIDSISNIYRIHHV